MGSVIRTILVPVDGSAGSGKAVALGSEFARACEASLTLLYVLPAESMVTIGAQALTDEQFEEAKDRMARRAFEPVRAATAEGARVVTETAIGNPSQEIIEHARRNHMDLIVIGSRGLSEFQQLLLGSVSSQVVHHASCSVVVAR